MSKDQYECSLCKRRYKDEGAVARHAAAYHPKRADDVVAIDRHKAQQSGNYQTEGERQAGHYYGISI